MVLFMLYIDNKFLSVVDWKYVVKNIAEMKNREFLWEQVLRNTRMC